MTGILYHAPSEIMAQALADFGAANIEDTGTSDPITGWTVFPMHLPDTPEQAMMVKDTAGRLHRRMQVTGVAGEHYGIQILARSSVDPATAFKKIKSILEMFDNPDVVLRTLVTLLDDDGISRTYRINAVTRTSAVIPAGNDGRRYFFSGNAVASIELVEGD